ncbi:MAG: hypothetical protein M1282_09395 [Chloroflexi bacterium]|nr:hypothetical protein [Chloroflexota bacterium]
MVDQKLMDYFKFDEADLQANRSGQFSTRQKNRLFGRHVSAVREKRIASGIGIPVSLIMLGLMVYLIYKDIASGGTGADAASIIWLGLCGLPLLAAMLYVLRISFIGPKYLLKKADGAVNIIRESKLVDNTTCVNYELHVGGETFNLHDDSTVGDVMMQGDTYAVYYSQGVENNLREILSAELISKAK